MKKSYEPNNSTGDSSAAGRALQAEQHAASLRVSYWAIVWGQFRKKRIAVFGMWCVIALFLLAIYAPLICLDKPFFYKDHTGLSFPLFKHLFNRLFFENSVDVFFNLILTLSPLYIALYYIGCRVLRNSRRWGRGHIVGFLVAAQFLIFFAVSPQRILGWANPLYSSSASRNYAEPAPNQSTSSTALCLFPIYRHNYSNTDPKQSLNAPSWTHWFGTDKEGRDVLARILYGTRISLTIGVVAVSIYVAIGIFLGALAGYFGGWIDMLISRLIEVMICFPTFFLILTLAAFVEERSIFHVMVIIGITSWPGVARLVRAEFLKQRNLEYSQAALALGISRPRIIFRHILPNALAPVLVAATFGVASAILTESALSFLGLGDVSAPSWGALLNAGRLDHKLWLVLFPGFPIFFVVSIFNLVGEGLRDALDPKLRI
ncbi:MAG: ABC transporter permease [Candidatus Sumerlaeota bacterium]|nr:ABC transporter permease [Candidatus Sumerlaeota bacterium]